MPDTHMTRPDPILYSFRRCPYAMRARLAIKVAGFQCELREIVLRDKALELLETSPKGTVPVLVLSSGVVLEESLEIMLHVLGIHDPECWLPDDQNHEDMMTLIAENDGPFKAHLDRTKYANRFNTNDEPLDPAVERDRAMTFIAKLNARLSEQEFLYGSQPRLADMAILPFVRQFAHIDIDWFHAQPVENVSRWLKVFLSGNQFKSIMTKYKKWQAEHPPILFP